MRDDVSAIIRITWSILLDDSHDPPHELSVRDKVPVGAKDCCDAESRVIRTFGKHLHLYDGVQMSCTQTTPDSVSDFLIQIAVQNFSFVVSFLIQRSHGLR